MGKILALCVSEARGTPKRDVGSAQLVTGWGIQGDAHAGHWHRQVSLLPWEEIRAFRVRGAQVDFGAFGENLVVEGFPLKDLPVGTRLGCGEVVLELTQVGKECHHHCAIYEAMGECIMPREGVFARVIHGGTLSVGDELSLLEGGRPPLRAAVLTLSDAGAAGAREDQSGPAACALLEAAGYRVVHTALLPDGVEPLASELRRLCDGDLADLILTTGGTGFSPRDLTPEATRSVVERPAPGIAEALRWRSLQITPRAMLSRGEAGIRRGALIVNLPGSPKAVRECLEFLLPPLAHGLEVLKGAAGDCAR